VRNLFTLIGIGAAVLLLLFASLPGCAPAPEKVAYESYVASLPAGCEPVPPECFEQAVDEGKLYIYEWAEWWPDDIFDGFSEEFGIEVSRDYFASTEEVKTKFALYPETPYDLVTGLGISDAYPLQEAGAAGQINPDWIPNVLEYMPEELMELEHDPGMQYSVPTDMYFTSYVYNKELVDDPRIPSWSVLFEPAEEFYGKVTLWDEIHETIGAALKYLGYDYYSVDEAELMEARDLLLELKPHLLSFDSWPRGLLLGDEAWISGLWYGDGWFLNDEYEAIVPALPAEGTNLGIDLAIHPIGSANPAAAHLFLNYLFRPEVNALHIESIWYPPVHTAVLELLPEEFLKVIALPEGYLAKCDPFDPRAVTGRGLELRIEIFEELKR